MKNCTENVNNVGKELKKIWILRSEKGEMALTETTGRKVEEPTLVENSA